MQALDVARWKTVLNILDSYFIRNVVNPSLPPSSSFHSRLSHPLDTVKEARPRFGTQLSVSEDFDTLLFESTKICGVVVDNNGIVQLSSDTKALLGEGFSFLFDQSPFLPFSQQPVSVPVQACQAAAVSENECESATCMHLQRLITQVAMVLNIRLPLSMPLEKGVDSNGQCYNVFSSPPGNAVSVDPFKTVTTVVGARCVPFSFFVPFQHLIFFFYRLGLLQWTVFKQIAVMAVGVAVLCRWLW